MNKEQEGRGFPTPVAKLLQAVDSLNYVRTNPVEDQAISLAEWVARGCPRKQQVEVPLSSIVRDPEFQVRKRTSQPTIKKYAASMEAGGELPPVQLGAVDGVLVLVDGWHRIAAVEMLEADSVVAVITPMTYDEAKGAAAKANLHHGLPLTDAEVLDAFRAYIEAKEYKKGKTWLSYRQIAQEFGRSHGTIRTWMERYFPKVFRKYQERAPGTVVKEEYSGSTVKKPKEDSSLSKKVVQEAQAVMSNARKLGKTISPKLLGSLIQDLQETLEALKKLPYTKPSEDALLDF